MFRSVYRSSLLLLSSVNISLTYISSMTWPILTRLGHKYRLTIPFMSYDQIGVKGHIGVAWVKKVIFTKNATSSTDNVIWSCDLCMWKSLKTSTKVTILKIHPGSFGVTGVKNKVKFKTSWHVCPFFHLSNDVQCSEALIRIKRSAEYLDIPKHAYGRFLRKWSKKILLQVFSKVSFRT